MKHDYKSLANALAELLALQSPPLAITFSQQAPAGVPRCEGMVPMPAADGRTGKVSAGCVFWMKAVDRTFHTCAGDHGNCSVGSLTHGFITLDVAATPADVKALVDACWVTPEVFLQKEVVAKLKSTCGADKAVAAYAAEDARRLGRLAS